MANKNSKRVAKQRRKTRAAEHWADRLRREVDKHKVTLRSQPKGY